MWFFNDPAHARRIAFSVPDPVDTIGTALEVGAVLHEQVTREEFQRRYPDMALPAVLLMDQDGDVRRVPLVVP